MANRIQYTIGLNADATQLKAQLQSVQMELNKLASATKITNLTPELQSATMAAASLSSHLKAATNVETGKLDLSKLSSSLQKSGISLAEYGRKLQMLGPQGTQAFTQVARAIANAEMPLKRTSAMMDKLWLTMKNTMRWQITSSALQAFTGALSTAYGYAQDLDKSLNNIRIVSGQSVEQMAEFAKEANKAAKALNVSTTDYTKGALIYYQQGLNEKQVKERTDITAKMVNVTGDSADQVSSYMTAIWNNFDDGTKSLEYFADAMTALGAETAASTAEIADSLEKFAAIGETVGLSYEYATAAATTLIAETRQSADTVGTALKTIFARMQDLELGETLDDGTTLGKYSQALAAIGVNIQDANGGLKDMNVIIDELGQKWDTLDRATKTAVAQAVGGTRQYQQLIGLMDNYDVFKENVSIASGSEGTLQEQADIYAESWEAANKRVRASAEDVYATLFQSDDFIKIMNHFADFIGVIDNVLESLGGLPGLLNTIAGLMMTIYGKQMSEGLRNMMFNLRQIVGLEKQRAIELQQSGINTLKSMQMSASSTGEKAILEMYIQEAELKHEINNASEYLTEQQKENLKIQQDTVRTLGQQVEKYQQIAAETEKKAVKDYNYVYETLLEQPHYETEKIIGANGTDAVNNFKKQVGEKAFSSITNNNKGMVGVDYFKALDLTKETAAQHGALNSLKSGLAEIKINTEEGQKAFQNYSEELKKLGISTDSYEQAVAEVSAREKEAQTIKVNLLQLFKESGLLNDQELARLREMTDAIYNNAQANISAGQATGVYGKAIEETGNKIAEAKLKSADWATIIVSAGQALSSLAMSIQAIQNLGSIWNNEDLTTGEKLIQTVSSLGMILTSVSMTLNSLNSLLGIKSAIEAVSVLINAAELAVEEGTTEELKDQVKWKKAATTEDTKQLALQMAQEGAEKKNSTGENFKFSSGQKFKLGAKEIGTKAKNLGKSVGTGLLKIAPALVIIAGTAMAVKAVLEAQNKELNEATARLESTTEAYNNIASAAQEAAQEYENLNATISNYNDALTSLDSLKKGTIEFKEAIFEANSEAQSLIAKYPELADKWEMTDGVITFQEGAVEAIREQELQDKISASNAEQLAKVAKKQAQIDVDLAKTKKKIADETNWSDAGEAAAVGGSAAAVGVGGWIAGAKIGATIGSAAGPWGGLIGAAVGTAAGAIGSGIAMNELDNKADEQTQADFEKVYQKIINTNGAFALTSQNLEQLGISSEHSRQMIMEMSDEILSMASAALEAKAGLQAVSESIVSAATSSNINFQNASYNQQNAINDALSNRHMETYNQKLAEYRDADIANKRFWIIGDQAMTDEGEDLANEYISKILEGQKEYINAEAFEFHKDSIEFSYYTDEGKQEIELSQEQVVQELANYAAEMEITTEKITEMTAQIADFTQATGKTGDALLALTTGDYSKSTPEELQKLIKYDKEEQGYKIDRDLMQSMFEQAGYITTTTQAKESAPRTYAPSNQLKMAVLEAISKEDPGTFGFNATELANLKSENDDADLTEKWNYISQIAAQLPKEYDFSKESEVLKFARETKLDANLTNEDGSNWTIEQTSAKFNTEAWVQQDWEAISNVFNETIQNEEELEKAIQAVEDAYDPLKQIAQQTAALEAEFNDIISETASSLELSEFAVKAYTDSLIENNDALQKNKVLAAKLAKEQLTFAKSMHSVAKAISDNEQALRDWASGADDSSIDALEAVSSIAEELKNIYDIEFSANFIKENFGIISKASQGSAEDIDLLQEKVNNFRIDSLATSIEDAFDNLDVDTRTTLAEKLGLTEDVSISTAIGDIFSQIQNSIDQGQFTMPQSYFDGLNQMIQAGLITTEQVQSIFDGMNLEVPTDTITLEGSTDTITQKVAVTETDENWNKKEGAKTSYTTSTITTENPARTYTIFGKANKINNNNTTVNSKNNNQKVETKKTVTNSGVDLADALKDSENTFGDKGGGSSNKDPYDYTEDIDRYAGRLEDVTAKVESHRRALEELDDQIEKTFGLSRLDAYKDKLSTLNEIKSATSRKLTEAQQYEIEDINAFNNISSVGRLQKDNITGQISNAGALRRAIEKRRENELAAYNGATDDASQEAVEAINKKYDRQIEKLDQAVDINNEVLDIREEIRDVDQEIVEAKIAENQALRNDLKTINDMRNDALDFQAKYNELLYDGVELEKEQAYIEQQKSMQAISGFTQMQKEFNALEAMRNSGELTGEQYAEAMQELADAAWENGEALIEYAKYMEELLPNALSAAREEFDELTESLEKNATRLDSFKEALSLQRGNLTDEEYFGIMDSVNKTSYENAMADVAANAEYVKMIQDQINSSDYNKLSDEQKKALQNELVDAEQLLAESGINAMQLAQEIYILALEKAARAYEETIAGAGRSLQDLQDEYDLLIEKDERYLDAVNDTYEVNKLNRDINKAIDKSSSTMAANRLKELQKEIDLRRENGKLTQYDLDILRAKYDLTLAQNALEEAQNAKSQVRLVRDSQGNWNYQYTADQAAIDNAQQALEDAQNNYYNTAKDRMTQITSDILALEQETQQKIQAVFEDTTLSAEEQKARARQIAEEANIEYQYLVEQYKESVGDVTAAGNEVISNFQSNLATEVDNLVTSSDNFNTAITNYIEASAKAAEEQAGRISTAAEASKTNATNITNGLGSIKTAYENVAEAAQKWAEKTGKELSDITSKVAAYQELSKTIQDVIEKYRSLGYQTKREISEEFYEGTDYSKDFNDALENHNRKEALEAYANKWAKIYNLGWDKAYFDSKGWKWSTKEEDWARFEEEFAGSFDTGGYTGNWNSNEGKLAILHEKELVLNKMDTQRILAAVEAVRSFDPSDILMNMDEIIDNYKLQISTYLDSYNKAIQASDNIVQQIVSIDAHFDGVTSAIEIEQALNNLLNDTAQYVNTRR